MHHHSHHAITTARQRASREEDMMTIQLFHFQHSGISSQILFPCAQLHTASTTARQRASREEDTMIIQLFQFQHSGISSQILTFFYDSRLRKRIKEHLHRYLDLLPPQQEATGRAIELNFLVFPIIARSLSRSHLESTFSHQKR